MGEAIGLSLAVGGATPFFISDLCARVISEGIDKVYEGGTLERCECLENEFIDVYTSETISRVSVVEKGNSVPSIYLKEGLQKMKTSKFVLFMAFYDKNSYFW